MASPSPIRQQRRRVPGALYAPPAVSDPKTPAFEWSDKDTRGRPATAGILIAAIMRTDAYEQTVGRYCDEVDAVSPRSSKGRAYSSRELESAEQFFRMVNARSARLGRAVLAGDEAGPSRLALGFDRPRHNIPWQKRLAGVPSEASLTRHRARFCMDQLSREWLRCMELLAEDNVRHDPSILGVVGIDGTDQPTNYTVPVYDKTTRKIRNADRVTAWQGGRRAPSMGKGGKAGCDGWVSHIALSLTAGLPLAIRVAPANEAEPGHAEDMLRSDHWAAMRAHMPADKVTAVVMDGGYNKPNVRRAVHDAGAVEVCHHASHGGADASKRNAANRDKKTWAIEGFPNWTANGHRELSCRCGNGQVSKRIGRHPDGEVFNRVEGACRTCGPISITAGDWRTSRNPAKFVRCRDAADRAAADWSFGNGLTYNDKLASDYGHARYGRQEGFYGMASHRFDLGKKRRYRYESRVRRDWAMVAAGLHVAHALARDAKLAAASHPPPLALAA